MPQIGLHVILRVLCALLRFDRRKGYGREFELPDRERLLVLLTWVLFAHRKAEE